jgi:hypothetical protein
VSSFAVASLGCARATFTPNVKSIGEYKNMAASAVAAEKVADEEAKDVRVLVGSIPPGMTYEHEVLSVDPDQYEVLGKVEAKLNNPTAANLGLWVYDYAPDERWRVGFCAWQVPLSWVTFSLWSWLSPTHYPCKAVVGDEESRTATIVQTLKRAGKAIGADLVVVPTLGGTVVISGTEHSATVSTWNATNATGYAVKRKRHEEAAAASAGARAKTARMP